MSDTAVLRERILAEPDVVLDDPDVMRALVQANERALGSNIVDLRGIAMERLEARLDRLEDSHRSVIAAAYENLAGTNQVHRAILRLLEPTDFTTFLADLCGEVAEILRVDRACIVLECEGEAGAEGPLASLEGVLQVEAEGFIDGYIQRGRSHPVRQVSLRQIGPADGDLYGDAGAWLRSEACLKLDLGAHRLPGMLALGAEDPHHFAPNQGTDLLTFFGGVVERAMRRWLA